MDPQKTKQGRNDEVKSGRTQVVGEARPPQASAPDCAVCQPELPAVPDGIGQTEASP